MLREGRPYTNENNDIDSGLLTSEGRFTESQLGLIDEWIKRTFEHADEVYPITSYGMKHWLQEKHDIYMTNNEFKDAMLLAGFEPVDPDELNWHYKVSVHREDAVNPFAEWIVGKKHLLYEGPARDQLEEYLKDPELPVFAEHDIIKNFISSQPHCNSDVITCFEDLWEAWDILA